MSMWRVPLIATDVTTCDYQWPMVIVAIERPLAISDARASTKWSDHYQHCSSSTLNLTRHCVYTVQVTHFICTAKNRSQKTFRSRSPLRNYWELDWELDAINSLFSCYSQNDQSIEAFFATYWLLLSNSKNDSTNRGRLWGFLSVCRFPYVLLIPS